MTATRRTAVVTGGARGIGEGAARVLAARGVAVAVWDLDGDGAAAVARSIAERGGTAVAVPVDCTDREAVDLAATETERTLGPVGILVNNAGTAAYDDFLEMTEAQWDRIQRINVKGPFLVTRRLLPGMRAAGWGRIVNVSSSAAQIGAPRMAHYAASKGAIVGFTKALAQEFVADGITVNHVPPGAIDTPLSRQGADMDAVARALPMGRLGTPEDVAHAIAYLASEEAGYVTGTTLSVNGGVYSF